MPKVKWIVEQDLYNSDYIDIDDITNALQRLGNDYQVVTAKDYLAQGLILSLKPPLRPLHPNDCFMTYGSIPLVERVRYRHPWIPGAFYGRKEFRASYYYSQIEGSSKVLLNIDSIWVPTGLFLDNPHKYFALWPREEEDFFVRPDSGSKPFIGQVIARDDIGSLWNEFSYCDKETLMMIGPAINIDSEWRFFTDGKEIITGSLYRDKRWPKKLRAKPSDEAWKYAQSQLGLYKPSPVFALDICKAQVPFTEFRIMEYSAFSCAGLYAADVDLLFEAVNKEAIKAWEEEHDATGTGMESISSGVSG